MIDIQELVVTGDVFITPYGTLAAQLTGADTFVVTGTLVINGISYDLERQMKRHQNGEWWEQHGHYGSLKRTGYERYNSPPATDAALAKIKDAVLPIIEWASNNHAGRAAVARRNQIALGEAFEREALSLERDIIETRLKQFTLKARAAALKDGKPLYGVYRRYREFDQWRFSEAAANDKARAEALMRGPVAQRYDSIGMPTYAVFRVIPQNNEGIIPPSMERDATPTVTHRTQK